jgi:hypothetical protein
VSTPPSRVPADASAATRADVWLGDLIQAWRALAVAEEEADKVARLMGFGLPAVTVSEGGQVLIPSHGSSAAEPAAPARPAQGRASRGAKPEAVPAHSGAPEATERLAFRRNLRPVQVDIGLRAEPGSDTGESNDLLAAKSPRRSGPLPLLPLLPTRITPGILTGCISTDAGDGMLDVDALVELAAQRRFEEAIPRVVRASLFRGVQLLLDRSPAMTPFARDVTELARTIRSVIGHNVEEFSFSGHPLHQALPGTALYAPPRPGTPVLALTDLGIGQAPGYLRPDADTTWPSLAELLLRRGSELVALVPYPRSRWPALGGYVHMIPWDAATSPADVTRAVGRILGGPRGHP